MALTMEKGLTCLEDVRGLVYRSERDIVTNLRA